MNKDKSTEEKIKDAARKVFTQKGYAATRTRDIAEASGVNLALLNYYFKSKENLFDIIMLENIREFSHSVLAILNNRDTSFYQKIELLAAHYIDKLIQNPEIPIFLLAELKDNPKKLFAAMDKRADFRNSIFVQQSLELKDIKKTAALNPFHIIMNMVSMIIFPFIANPMIRNRTGMNQEQFNNMMLERKKLIPVWITEMIQQK